MKRLNLVLLIGFMGIGMSTVACGGDSEPSGESATPAATSVVAPPGAAPPATFPTGSPAGGLAESANPRPRLVAALRGLAEIGYLAPVSRRDGGDIVTTFQVKNLALGAIAGLKIDEFWYDVDGNPVGGATERLEQPLLPGEEVTMELRVPSNSQINTSNYVFSHQNGDIRATELAEFRTEGEEPDPDPDAIP